MEGSESVGFEAGYEVENAVAMEEQPGTSLGSQMAGAENLLAAGDENGSQEGFSFMGLDINQENMGQFADVMGGFTLANAMMGLSEMFSQDEQEITPEMLANPETNLSELVASGEISEEDRAQALLDEARGRMEGEDEQPPEQEGLSGGLGDMFASMGLDNLAERFGFGGQSEVADSGSAEGELFSQASTGMEPGGEENGFDLAEIFMPGEAAEEESFGFAYNDEGDDSVLM
ncbi:hypothetical protein [Gloeobacter morelensis]|uniref:Uncharacterized protein n=1 Tax=Gloeobacter morelensis MG652769 TaxID=2781736 RepID=A0ABY3PI39_9CYAN|nr:hypothetical protein [Gloeobacter morelensis]UFP93345.1 hypothetical protein ISF26_16265 [Gloeobacter morelensis MG652769]